ncbi:META domain-containing protein [Burkholderia glumae]|uniref:META domain-containing protein n=1 Tax=Burkholderia glumae TaxID=337 RepID=UPI0003034E44|nr:META domain-containing protein [Burkholderia glumae]MCQ0029614.1 META domain-containing protein [Burkholderia glumae]MCQ0039459.1 META domain-containing protein [Burkholderia glumae]PJO23940.1 META domain-containing protein [Burkholderia glumae AU6208]QHE11289.1 META domain-containing protein [Burkholderia glumae AU6208]QJP72331.1 META domain-containing protein [Burkholderia glumae]
MPIHFAALSARLRFVGSLRAPFGAAALAACALTACAIPAHPDASAPPSDPFNPAAIQLIDDTSWELTNWRNADGSPRELPPGGTGANGAGAASDQSIRLQFSTADGVRRASGFAGCNRYAGTYMVKNGLLSFGPLAGTRRACAGPAGRIEPAYLDALAHIARAGVQMQPPQQLYLVTDSGATLTFARRDAP